MRWLKKRPEKAYCRLLRENTTFHGIRDSIATGASMAALIGCGFIVWEFNNRPLSVTYSIRENVSLIIPDIIICPFNRFNKTYLNYWNVSDNLAQYLELAFPQASQHPFQYKSYKNLIDKINELEEELNKLLLNIGISFAEFIDKAAINCRAFFVNDKSICDNSKELMSMTGKCFRIKGEEQKIDGNGHPQKLILNLPTKLFNPAPNQMLNNGILKCKTICLPPCRNWRFDKTISYANFPSEIAKHFVKDKTKWENLQNTIILDVFYTTLDYTVIQQMLTITPSSFIAQLGDSSQKSDKNNVENSDYNYEMDDVNCITARV
uniref:Uncharacterized protein n=1 Tax=Meloidogyne javanica TaxID=6303 RepID=A0A915MI83_MELJA